MRLIVHRKRCSRVYVCICNALSYVCRIVEKKLSKICVHHSYLIYCDMNFTYKACLLKPEQDVQIFNMHRWESVKAIQYHCGNFYFARLCDLRRLHFLHKMSVCRNVALKECFYRTDVDYLCYEYNVNFSLSLSVINQSVCRKFGVMCKLLTNLLLQC